MRDGRTRKLDVEQRDGDFASFEARWKASVVVLTGGAAGTEYAIDRPNLAIGRGSGADLSFPDPAMSREHAALEFSSGGIRLRDLGSMNGVLLNGTEVRAADLKNGDRFQLGEHVFQFVLEHRKREPRTYVLPDD